VCALSAVGAGGGKFAKRKGGGGIVRGILPLGVNGDKGHGITEGKVLLKVERIGGVE